MMKVSHRLLINIADRSGQKQSVVRGTVRHLPRRLIQWLFGEYVEVLVLTPGKTVEGIEIREVPKGDIAPCRK